MSLIRDFSFLRLLILLFLTKPMIGSIVSDNGDHVIYTCCKIQSTLDAMGFCDQVISEFDLSFPLEWTVPTELTSTESSLQPFRLLHRPRHCVCSNNFIEHTALIVLLKSNSAVKNPNEFQNYELKFSQDGDLLLTNGSKYSKEQFCINRLPFPDEDSKLELRIFSRPCSSSSSKTLPKTVQDHYFYMTSDQSRTECGAGDQDSYLQINEASGNRSCSKLTSFYSYHGHIYLVGSNTRKTGIEDSTYPWTSFDEQYFCTNSHQTDTTDTLYVKFCIPEIKKLFSFCQNIYATLAGVSGIFLLINLSIYCALRSALNISGWTEFLYSISLYAYCVFSIPGLLIVPEDSEIRTSCYVISICVQFFELANGATLVALSFDILLTFWKYDKQGYTDDPKVSKFRLSIYFIISLTVPSGLVTYGIIKNQQGMFAELESFGAPQYGLLHCTSPDWLLSTYVQFGMQGLNLLLVMISAYIILNKRGPRHDFGVVEEVLMELDPDRMDIFSKLFVYVFVFWIVDFMELFYSKEVFTFKWYGITFKVINYSQGIFAFFILVFNKQTYRAVSQKDWSLKNMFRHACCSCSRDPMEDMGTEIDLPSMSPLMRTGTIQSYKRPTVRGDKFY